MDFSSTDTLCPAGQDLSRVGDAVLLTLQPCLALPKLGVVICCTPPAVRMNEWLQVSVGDSPPGGFMTVAPVEASQPPSRGSLEKPLCAGVQREWGEGRCSHLLPNF